MKIHGKFAYKPYKPYKPESCPERRQESVQAAEFHNKRIHREIRLESARESLNKPQGTDEYQQRIAEDASINSKPMVEIAAFFIAERRGFAPGAELTDWLQAESEIETGLRRPAVDRRNPAQSERRAKP